jgi:glycosyltransferase involved in cell wall biosynthesis
MRSALLLQNVEGFPSPSSARYAASLFQALTRVGQSWDFHMPLCQASQRLSRLVGRANSSRWDRLVRLPRAVRQWRQSCNPHVTHLLDHSHANTLRACDPSRCVVTLHDVIPLLSSLGELDFNRGRFVGYTFKKKLRLIERCAAIIVPSLATKNQLLRFVDLPKQHIHVVPHGVEQSDNAFQPRPTTNTTTDNNGLVAERQTVRSSIGLAAEHRFLLHVCTRNRYKNSPCLIRALSRLPSTVVLVRVGADLFDDEAQLADSLGVRSRIFNVGRLATDAELAAYYRSADVFVFPSTFEGFGWPVVEAMACGTPVVCSNAGSLPEVGGEAAILVDPHDDKALADAVTRLIDDPDEHSRRRQLSIDWAGQFTWEETARKVLAVYEQVVDGRRSLSTLTAA